MAGQRVAHDGAGGPLIGSPGFVGREREMAALCAALSRPPAVVLVEGEAGVGKSRLLTELRDSTSEAGQRRSRWLVAHCSPFRAPYTLGPVIDVLRAATDGVGGLRLSGLAGALRPLFPEWAAKLPPPPEPLEDARATRYRLFRAVAELLGQVDVDVLAVEDVHWADEATLEFLLFLVSGRLRHSLVVTYRTEDLPADSLLPRMWSRLPADLSRLRLPVDALDAAGTGGLVSSMLSGERVSERFAAFLHERTGGIPLVVEETVRLMGERADLVRRDGAWLRRPLADVDVPQTVRDAVLGRAARLDSDAQAVLRAAALLAEPAGDALLVAVSGLPADRVATGLVAVLGSGLLGENERGLVEFRHTLAARAVYESIAGPQRRAAHLRAGHALESANPPPLARLARHFQQGGDLDRWRRYAERAAEQALASADEAAAAALLYDVMVTGDLPPATLCRLADQIPAGPITGTARCTALADTFRAALAGGSLEPAEEGELRLHLGRLLNMLDDGVAAHEQFQRAAANLEHDPGKAIRAMAALSRPRHVRWPAAEHLRWLRRAGGLAADLPAGDRLRLDVARAEVLLTVGDQAGWELANRLLDDRVTTLTRETAVRLNLNVGDLATQWGHYPRARQWLAAAGELIDRDQYPHVQDMVQACLTRLDWHIGRWVGLADRAAAQLADEHLLPVSRVETELVAGLLHMAGGDDARATSLLEHVSEECRRRGTLEIYPEPAGGLARIHLDAGRVAEAVAVTEDPVGVIVGKDIWLWATGVAPVRVAALLAAGRAEDATDLVTRFAAGLRGRDIPAARAALAQCRAILTEHRDSPHHAAAAYRRAAAAWQRLPRPYDALLATERQAHCLLAAGQDDRGRALLVNAHTGLAELAARGDAARVARRLRQLGVEVARRGRRGYGDQLSPRELDVVRLVATGRTNREIAVVLVLSPRTVAGHLDGAMRKLGVSSRTALAVRAVETGIAPEAPVNTPAPGRQ